MDTIDFLLEQCITVSVITVAVVVYYLLQSGEKSAPGPKYIPFTDLFLGIIPGLVGDITGPLLTKWAKEADSNILCLKIVGVKVAVISSYDFMKETFGKRADLADRPEGNLFQTLNPEHDGIILSSGEIWRDSRRVTLRRMRDLGMSTSGGQQFVTQEAEILIKTIQEANGEPMNMKPLITLAVANVFSGFAFGKRFDYSDPKFQLVLESTATLATEGAGPVAQLVLPFRVGRWIYKEKMRVLRDRWDGITRFVDDQIAEHAESFDGTESDLTYAFLSDERDGGGRFSHDQIRANLIDMLLGGADTSTIQLQWLLLYMARYQQVQKIVHQEILENIGNKLPSMNDKRNTPYTEATVNEVMRMNTILFTGLPRTNNSRDFEIGGYKFKKGTPVLANYWSIHNDPEFFPNPEKFDPGHFLTEDGKTTNLERMVSFTIGRRSCVGESLARIEIYLFFVMFVQKFIIRGQEGVEVDLKPIKSSVYEPGDVKIRLIPRAD